MAKPIAPTPVLTGQDARAVLRELECGTQMTPARNDFLRQSQSAFERHRSAFTREGVKSDR